MGTFRSRAESLVPEERKLQSGEVVKVVKAGDVASVVFKECSGNSFRTIADMMGVEYAAPDSNGCMIIKRLCMADRGRLRVSFYPYDEVVSMADAMDVLQGNGWIIGMVRSLRHIGSELAESSCEVSRLRKALDDVHKVACDSCAARKALADVAAAVRMTRDYDAEDVETPTCFTGRNCSVQGVADETCDDGVCLFKTFTVVNTSDSDALRRVAATLNKTRCSDHLGAKDAPLPVGECIAVVTGVTRGKNSAGDKDVVKLHMMVQHRPGERIMAYTESLPVGKAMNIAVDKASSIVAAACSGNVAWTFENIDDVVIGKPFMTSFARDNKSFTRMVNCKRFVSDDWKAFMAQKTSAWENDTPF